MEEMVEVDVKYLLKEILKRGWIILLCAILTAAISLVYTVNFVTPTYKASATMYVSNSTGSGMTSSDLAVALQLANTYVIIIQSDEVLNKVVEKTGLNLTVSQIRGMMSAEVINETEVFRVNVISPDPQMSADIANAIASVAPAEITRIIEGSTAKVVDYAKVPTARYAPSYVGNTVLGGLVGAALVIAVIVILLLSDNRIRNDEDLIKIYQAPVLGAIPDFLETAKQSERMSERKGGRNA